jgi:hypothetical protein
LASTVLRRALGNVLVKGFCPYDRPRCQPTHGAGGQAGDLCQLAESCPYGVLYAHSQSKRPPFALYVPPVREGKGEAGVELTLFGPATRLHGWVLQALAGACHGGLGKARLRWDVKGVAKVDPNRQREYACGAAVQALAAVLPEQRLELGADIPGAEPTQVEVRFESPTRLLYRGRLVGGSKPVPCELLIARILDRFAGLFGEDADPCLQPAARQEIEKEARRVRLLIDETHWLDVNDYSSRQRTEMLMGGKVGRLVYGDVGPRLMSILRAGEILHVGKNPGFGCGRLTVTPIAGSATFSSTS